MAESAAFICWQMTDDLRGTLSIPIGNFLHKLPYGTDISLFALIPKITFKDMDILPGFGNYLASKMK